MKLLRWSVAKGNLAIRTHVDTTDPSLMAVDVLLEVREEMKDFVDIQLVAFPQDGVLRAPRGVELLERAWTRAWTWSAASRISSGPWTRAGSRCACCARSRQARAHGRHALRRVRRSAFPARGKPGVETQRTGAAGPGHGLAPDEHALHGQLLRLEAVAAHGRGECTACATRW
jgi:hypothetical protein